MSIVTLTAANEQQPTRLLPLGSQKATCLTLHAVRTCHPRQEFSARWLKSDRKIVQNNQAMRLLRFLDFLDGEYLRDDVIETRSHVGLLRDLITSRVHVGCRNAEIPQPISMNIGAEAHEWCAIRSALLESPPISNLRHNVQRNVIGAFRALDTVIRNLRVEGWLEANVRLLGHDEGGVAQEAADQNVRMATNGDDTLRYSYGTEERRRLFASITFAGPIAELPTSALRKVARQLNQMADQWDEE